MTRAKVQVTDMCRCLYLHMIKVFEWHLLLKGTLFESAKLMEKMSTYLYYRTRDRLFRERIIHHECPSELSIQEFVLFSKV